MYPELRILKHITYTVGESVLYQFKYNNWRENQGFVNEEKNKDYRKEYFNKDNLSNWMLDDLHLTLDVKILESDADYPRFNEYWHDKAIGYAEEAKKADCPLNELDNIMGEFYLQHFREEGVEAFFRGKERAIPEMAREIRHKIETELYDKWKIGDVSIVELQKVSKLLLECVGEIRTNLDKKANDEKNNYDICDQDREATVEDWSKLGILQRMVGKGARLYADHQNILTDYYTSKTMLLAWEFAKKLAAKLSVELGKMDVDISAFGQKINDAIEETERLVAAQRKINKGLEDMKGAIIEVSEDDTMNEFETDLRTDKLDMPNIARQLRESILPKTEFVNFGNLANEISIDDIKDAFDVTLTQIVRTKHDEKANSEKKVLGLNILTQLQQKLKTDDDIKFFASKIVSQSGVYLRLNNDQIQLHLRNNEGNLSPTNPASINKKAILVSIPSPDDNENLKKFADKLETAFKNSFNQSTARTTITVNRKSPRKDELSIITVAYCFPMRAIEWMEPYRKRYEQFLHTGNVATDASNAILLHSEGDGHQFPPLFAVDNAEEIAARAAEVHVTQTDGTSQPGGTQAPQPPKVEGIPVPPPLTIPAISLFLAVGGQQYGPYNMDMCRQMVAGGQLTPQTMVWMEGMSAWTPAGSVPALKTLFAPPATPSMPPLPPTNGSVPPSIM